MIFPNLTATVGKTAMMEQTRVGGGLPVRIIAKLEMRNPCGSVKDRVSVALIDDAERCGILRRGDVNRSDGRKYPNRTCICGGCWGLSFDSDYAGNDVYRASRVAYSLEAKLNSPLAS